MKKNRFLKKVIVHCLDAVSKYATNKQVSDFMKTVKKREV